MKPCPFCGGKAKVMKRLTWGYVAKCQVCGAKATPKILPEMAEEAWNRRGPHGR